MIFLANLKNLLMTKIIYALLTVLAFASCADSYVISGTSNVSTLDGQKLSLKVLKNNEFKSLDSCDIVHGKFSFSGAVDSVCMGLIDLGQDNMPLPLVVEGGDINVKIDNAQMLVSGTPLNDKLFSFLSKYNQLENQKLELVHRHDQGIMNGQDMDVVNRKLNAEAARISEQEDKLVTGFVTENFDNVLGPGVFFLITAGNDYPMLSPWIEDIMSKATDKFKNDPYVKDYYEKAQENEQIMNGMKDPVGASPQLQAPADAHAAPEPQAPTPNELAKPAEPSNENQQ